MTAKPPEWSPCCHSMLQSTCNTAERMSLLQCQSDPATSVRKTLRWLPAELRIKAKEPHDGQRGPTWRVTPPFPLQSYLLLHSPHPHALPALHLNPPGLAGLTVRPPACLTLSHYPSASPSSPSCLFHSLFYHQDLEECPVHSQSSVRIC